MRTLRDQRGRSLPCFRQASGRATRRRGRGPNAPRTGPSSAQCSEPWSGSWDRRMSTASACRWERLMMVKSASGGLLGLCMKSLAKSGSVWNAEGTNHYFSWWLFASLSCRSWRICCWKPRRDQRAFRKPWKSRLETIAPSRTSSGRSSTASGSLWLTPLRRGKAACGTRRFQL